MLLDNCVVKRKESSASLDERHSFLNVSKCIVPDSKTDCQWTPFLDHLTFEREGCRFDNILLPVKFYSKMIIDWL